MTTYIANAHIVPKLGDIQLRKLTAPKIRTWLDEIAALPPRCRGEEDDSITNSADAKNKSGARARKATANRILTVLKAALNHAYKEGKALDAGAWARVKPFSGVEAARPHFLELKEAKKLIKSAKGSFGQLAQGALLTGARYGELTRLKVGDFRDGKVFIAESKSDKSRWINLTKKGKAVFENLTKKRDAAEYIFIKDGKPWEKGWQTRPMKEACKLAKIKLVGFHQLRHTYASLSLMSGMPIIILARNLGHVDTRMVERHYGHLLKSYLDDMIEKHAPKFGPIKRSTKSGKGEGRKPKAA